MNKLTRRTLRQKSRLMVSVVVPAKDEARSIKSLIPRIKESLSRYPHEIIVVDDGSRDGTREIAVNSGARVVSHKNNLGKGAAMKTGVLNARGEIIVFLDADGAHDPQDIPKVITPLLQNKAELVIGSRALPESKVSVAPITRKLTNSLASIVISVIISVILPLVTLFKCSPKWIRITDCTSGFRAVSREKWHELALTSQGFEIETEMIYEAARNKLTISDVPISCNWSSEISRLSILRDSGRTLKLLARKLLSDGFRTGLGAGRRK